MTDSESLEAGEDSTFPRHMVEARLPLPQGEFTIHLFEDEGGSQHLVLVMGDVKGKYGVLTRIHSECITGDLFGSMRCDCQSQLHLALEMIAGEGEGILIYLRQEGRGIGLLPKLLAYNLQDRGYDTVDANLALGYPADEREYDVAARLLEYLGIRSVRLLSNNPDKLRSLLANGLRVESLVDLPPRITEENIGYLRTKVSKLNHLLDLDAPGTDDEGIDGLESYIREAMEEKRDSFITWIWTRGLKSDIHSDGYLLQRMEALHSARAVPAQRLLPSAGRDALLILPLRGGGAEAENGRVHHRDRIGSLVINMPDDQGPDVLSGYGIRSLLFEAPDPGILGNRIDMAVIQVHPSTIRDGFMHPSLINENIRFLRLNGTIVCYGRTRRWDR